MDVIRINLSDPPSLDRFIRPTRSLNHLNANLNSPEDALQSLLDGKTFTNVALKRYYRNNYRIEMKKALFPSLAKRENDVIPSTNDWPVKPRNKPLMPEHPIFTFDIEGAVNVECSKRGAIAAYCKIHKSIIYMENIENAMEMRFIIPVKPINGCFKWNESGNLLAVPISRSRFVVFNIDTVTAYPLAKKKTSSESEICPCARISSQTSSYTPCQMACLIWSASDEVVTGCSKGVVTLYSKELKIQRFKTTNNTRGKRKIIHLSLSCCQTTIVVSTSNKRLFFLKFPKFKVIYLLDLPMSTKTISWHPWDNNLLVIGITSTLFLMNTRSTKVKYSIIEGTVDDLLFNPESAELLISKYDADNETSHFVIMRDLSVVVDEIVSQRIRMGRLFWYKNGTKLGALSTTSYIWNFFGKSTATVEKQREDHARHPFLRSAAGSLFN
ncbi:unnamed protein product [Phyllotreta striolata]|uniref:Uncharacterized protein n=1 Tax=Phyllotreta striolata TaxID=444603 RepID=A0A9N9XP94_PHYSR|nr:unnamed protein product [Phyllotreta striolata]